MTPCRTAAATAAMLLLAAAAAAQHDWVLLDGPVFGGGGVYDAARQRLVIVPGSGTLFELAGTRVVAHIGPAPPAAPVPRRGHALAYDPLRRHVLMFGGEAATALGDTWVWRGGRWELAFSTITPPRRSDAAMTFDAALGRVVMFGGSDQNAWRTDTWLHDGSEWRQADASGPGAAHPLLVCDEARGSLMLLASDTSLQPAAVPMSTFAWNGSGWTQESTPVAPLSRAGAAAAWDAVRQRAILIGGENGGDEVWEWDGTAWSLRAHVAEFARSGAIVWFDPQTGRIRVAGGHHRTTGLRQTDVWSWDGSSATRDLIGPSPAQRRDFAWFADVQHRGILFGGHDGFAPGDETWSWGGSRWQQLALPARPPARSGAAAAFDPLRGRTLLFGGAGTGGHLGDLWSWDGGGWSRLTSTNGPQPRALASMTFDRRRFVAVLFGGTDHLRLFGDTWEWNGFAWLPRQPAAAPSPRAGAPMVYDVRRDRSVMVGWATSDTWEWDGTTWQQRSDAAPPPLRDPALVYEPVRERVVMVGQTLTPPLPIKNLETWEFDGAAWTQVDSRPSPSAPQVLFDPRRGRLVAYDGDTVSEWTPTPARLDVVGTGCGDPVPVLTATARPRIGDDLFGLEVLVAPGSPVVFAIADRLLVTPLGGGCQLEIGAPMATALHIATSGGLAAQPVPLPLWPGLRGLEVHSQAGGLSATGGLSLTSALRIRVGD